MKTLTLYIVVYVFLMIGISVTTTIAQEPSDTLRDMFITVKEKQPSTFVRLTLTTSGAWSLFGPIAYIGDNYVCLWELTNGQPTTTEHCAEFKRISSVELRPGIHR